MRRPMTFIALLITALIAPIASGQPTDEPVETDKLRQRLEALEAEVEARREALAEARQRREQQLAALRETRDRLAREVVRAEQRRLTLERLATELDRTADAVQQRHAEATAAWRRVRDAKTVLIDQLDIFLGELPAQTATRDRLTEAGRSLADGDAEAAYEALAEVVNAVDAHGQTVRVRRAELRTADGRRASVDLLAIGHVGFAYRVGERIGMAFAAPADATGLRWREDLPADLRSQWRAVFTSVDGGAGDAVAPPLDATGRIRAEVALDQRGAADRFAAGGPVMWPLAGVAAICLVLLTERGWTLYVRNGSDAKLARRVIEALRQGDHGTARDIAGRRSNSVGRTLAAMLQRHAAGQHAMEDSVQEQLLYEWPRLNRFLRGIGILAAVAPLLGLLGTVTGIIRTFTVIRTVGNTEPSMMAGGISEALITTATGLAIAIPVLLVNGIMRGRVDRILAEAEEQAASVLNVLVHDRPDATQAPAAPTETEADHA